VTTTEAYYGARTMQALELLAFEPRSATQVAASLRVVPRTARRLLRRLVDEEYVICSASANVRGRQYALSMRLLALAGQALERADLPRVAAPIVSQLHEETGYTAHLLVPSYDCVLCVAHAEDGADAVPALRELAPCHCTAGGKALLSERPRWRDAILSGTLQAVTACTETDPEALRRELRQTAVRGYAIEASEHKPGQRGVAALVRTETREALAAVAVTTTRDLDAAAAARRVTAAATAVSAGLGCEIPGSLPGTDDPTRARL
jgi:DNA-binding IclR family transcriptional regulator